MKKLLVIVISTLMACGNPQHTANNQGADIEFENYKQNFINSLWKLYPGWASSQGYHVYDSIMELPDDTQRQKQLLFANANLDSLKGFDLNTLSNNNKTDYFMIRDHLQGTLWNITEEKSYEWNPAQYNVAEGFAQMLNNNYDTLETRLRNFNLRIKFVVAYYEAAKRNIKNPTQVHTQLAIDQNTGGASVFETDLPAAVAKSTLSDQEKKQLIDGSKSAAAAMRDFAKWLGELKNETPRDFRLGEKLYKKKFSHNIVSDYTADEIYSKALAHKKELHLKMAEITNTLWPKYFTNETKPADTLKMIRQMIDKLSLNHVKPDSFQAAIEKQIPELVKFINDKNLIYLDPSKPLVVRKEPDYMAGVAGASISSPGPYDKNGNTYYNVGSLSGWSAEQAESYLREYNHYILQILNIHEAIPGHYTQLVYSNQSPSLIKSILGDGTMVEGWAVYTERMMLEEGYGNNEPEMWLMYYKWNLRVTCNTILDYNVHTKNISKEDALKLLVNEAFQQQAEAEGKWKRACLTQVQLCSYFTGFTEIYDFRESIKKQMGQKFNLKNFHETFLSFGSAPVKYIKELMQ